MYITHQTFLAHLKPSNLLKHWGNVITFLLHYKIGGMYRKNVLKESSLLPEKYKKQAFKLIQPVVQFLQQ